MRITVIIYTTMTKLNEDCEKETQATGQTVEQDKRSKLSHATDILQSVQTESKLLLCVSSSPLGTQRDFHVSALCVEDPSAGRSLSVSFFLSLSLDSACTCVKGRQCVLMCAIMCQCPSMCSDANVCPSWPMRVHVCPCAGSNRQYPSKPTELTHGSSLRQMTCSAPSNTSATETSVCSDNLQRIRPLVVRVKTSSWGKHDDSLNRKRGKTQIKDFVNVCGLCSTWRDR